MPEETSLTVFDKFETQIVVLEEANAELDFDVSTPEGEQDCRDHHKKLRKGWNAIENMRKETKAKYLQLGKEVDTEAKSIQSRVDTMAAPHKAKLDKIDADKKAAAEAIIEAEDLAKAKAEEEKQVQAAAVEKELEDLKAQVKAQDDERLAKTAQEAREAREKQIAIDAADQATKDAEAKALRDAEAIEKKEQDRIAADLAKQNREAKIETDRVADVEHQRHIELGIANDIFVVVLDKPMANAVVAAIKGGLIPNIKIVY